MRVDTPALIHLVGEVELVPLGCHEVIKAVTLFLEMGAPYLDIDAKTVTPH